MFRSIFFHLLIGGLTLGWLVDRSDADEWTSLRGTSTVVAKLVGIWNDRALLRLENGRQVSVKLSELNADSRIQAQDQQAAIERTLRTRVSELGAVATEAAAPAPAIMPTQKPAPNYVPPTDGADLQSTLDHLQAQAKAGHFRVYYDALPKSQQAQAEELFKLALQKVDSAHWELFRSTMHRLADLTVTRQRWLFSHPKFAQVSDGQRQSLLVLASAFRQLGTEEIASLPALQGASLGESLARLDELAAPYLHQLIQENSMISGLVLAPYQVESGADGAMVAKQSPPLGAAQGIPMVQMEGRWTEGATVADAQAKWDGYKKSLASIPDGSIRLGTQVEAVLSNLSNSLSTLENASSRSAFHRALDDMSSELSPSINLWAGVKPQSGYDSYDPSMSSDPSMSYDPSMSSDPSMQGYDGGTGDSGAGNAAAEAAARAAAAASGGP